MKIFILTMVVVLVAGVFAIYTTHKRYERRKAMGDFVSVQ